jgi:hypothetical protein
MPPKRPLRKAATLDRVSASDAASEPCSDVASCPCVPESCQGSCRRLGVLRQGATPHPSCNHFLEGLVCFLHAFANVLLLEAATVTDACYLVLEWTWRVVCPGGPPPVVMFRAIAWERPSRKRVEGLIDQLSDLLDPAAHFSRIRLCPADDADIWANAGRFGFEGLCRTRRRARSYLPWTCSTPRNLGKWDGAAAGNGQRRKGHHVYQCRSPFSMVPS